MDVHFPKIPMTILVIDTTAYSGNFERQLCAYCTGQWDGETHGEPEARDAFAANPDIVGRLSAKSMPLPHESYGILIPEVLRATPGRVNDGMGGHMDADEAPAGKPTWPAYESIGIFLVEPLDAEEMAFVRQRAADFAADPMAYGERGDDDRRPFEIRDIYQVARSVDGTETRLP